MSNINRRDFLKGSTMAAAAAGVMVSLPAMPALMGLVDTEGPAVDSAVSGPAEDAVASSGASMTEPLIARVNDLATGEIQMFFGTNEIIYKDPQLAARLFAATR